MLSVLGNILCNHDPKIKVKSKKAGFCDGIPSTAFLSTIVFALLYNNLSLSRRQLLNIGTSYES